MNIYQGYLFAVYGFLFITSYLTMVSANSFKNKLYKEIYAGLIFALVVYLTILLNDSFDYPGIPDGRYVIAGILVFFFSVRSVLPLAVVVSQYLYTHHPEYMVESIVVFITVVAIFEFYRRSFGEKGRVRWWEILIIAITPSLVPSIFALVLFSNEVGTKNAMENIVYIFGVVILLTFMLYYSINREYERNLNQKIIENSLQELSEQNIEIQALYEEMAASEETLRENYDELNEYKNKIEFYAFHNPKTELYNKDYLIKIMELDKSKMELKGKYVFYLRLNNLEYYINSFGQSLIDDLHKNVAKQIRLYFGKEYVFDVSSGSYIIYQNELFEDECLRNISQIEEKLRNIELAEDFKISISLNVGGVKIDNNIENVSVWIDYAESAFSQSDLRKLNAEVVWFNKEMHKEKQRYAKLKIDLEKAIERDELYIVLQPQYNRESKIIGAEALLRWKHDELGQISPVIFIQIAEELGLIDKIGMYVVNRALIIIKSIMSERQVALPISINTSFIELMNPSYAERFNSMLEESEVDPALIHVEITETAMARNIADIDQNVRALANSKVDIHLDDFGTGYSSLSHLTYFPVQVVKLDKKFIDNISTDKKTEAIIKSVIELSHAIEMEVVAEGVESKDQFDLLQEMGCDYYQGYLFSKPLEYHDFLAKL